MKYTCTDCELNEAISIAREFDVFKMKGRAEVVTLKEKLSLDNFPVLFDAAKAKVASLCTPPLSDERDQHVVSVLFELALDRCQTTIQLDALVKALTGDSLEQFLSPKGCGAKREGTMR